MYCLSLNWLLFDFRLWSLVGFAALFFDVSDEFLTLLNEFLFFFLQLQAVRNVTHQS